MDKIIVLALILGAVAGLADGMLSDDGPLFTAVKNVVTNIVSMLDGIGSIMPFLLNLIS